MRTSDDWVWLIYLPKVFSWLCGPYSWFASISLQEISKLKISLILGQVYIEYSPKKNRYHQKPEKSCYLGLKITLKPAKFWFDQKKNLYMQTCASYLPIAVSSCMYALCLCFSLSFLIFLGCIDYLNSHTHVPNQQCYSLETWFSMYLMNVMFSLYRRCWESWNSSF